MKVLEGNCVEFVMWMLNFWGEFNVFMHIMFEI